MENKLEQLLNSLIERGWKPFGYKGMKATVNIYGEIRFEREGHFFIETFRTLTSKESNLWQFVCENKLVKKLGEDFKYFYNSRDNKSTLRYYEDRYKYWLLESSLKDESELEDFLLQNINVDVENRG